MIAHHLQEQTGLDHFRSEFDGLVIGGDPFFQNSRDQLGDITGCDLPPGDKCSKPGKPSGVRRGLACLCDQHANAAMRSFVA